MNPELFATYLVAACVVIAAPGPDSLNMLAIGMARGRREAVASAGGAGERLLGRPGFALWLNRVTGVLFIALALRLLLTERK